MPFDPGIDIKFLPDTMDFEYGNGVFGPVPEKRCLADIRGSLIDPGCCGPDPVYSIVMDVGKTIHRPLLEKMNLLYGVVAYAKGRLGSEPVRSQGHIHKVSPICGMSTPEVYEIWAGEAIIYMQESAKDAPGRCFAVRACPGEVVIVPPYWCHATISANSEEPLIFGAWCIRDYGFEYDDVRAHGGIAWFPLLDESGTIRWLKNDSYGPCTLVEKQASPHPELGITPGLSIYSIFEKDPETFKYVVNPDLKKHIWQNYIP